MSERMFETAADVAAARREKKGVQFDGDGGSTRVFANTHNHGRARSGLDRFSRRYAPFIDGHVT